MPSKWFLPIDESDMDFVLIEGQFPCQQDDCDEVNDKVSHFTKANKFGWNCAKGHRNIIDASKYV